MDFLLVARADQHDFSGLPVERGIGEIIRALLGDARRDLLRVFEVCSGGEFRRERQQLGFILRNSFDVEYDVFHFLSCGLCLLFVKC